MRFGPLATSSSWEWKPAVGVKVWLVSLVSLVSLVWLEVQEFLSLVAHCLDEKNCTHWVDQHSQQQVFLAGI